VQIQDGYVSKTKEGQNWDSQDMAWSSYAQEVLSEAATVDVKWQKLNSLFNSAIRAGIASWKKSHDLLNYSNAYENQWVQMSGICKVANVDAFAYSKAKNISPSDWAKSEAGALLPISMSYVK
jgi:hypothetical protein